MRVTGVGAALAVLVQVGVAAAQQAPKLPPSFDLIVPEKATVGAMEKAAVVLKDAAGKPVKATHDITFKISAPNAKFQKTTAVIPKGQSSIDVGFVASSPGVSNIKVEQLQAPETIRGAATQFAAAPQAAYTPKPPFSILLGISPRAQVIAGTEHAKIVARLLDERGLAASVDRDVSISFPELSDALAPHPLVIKAGEEYGESTWSPHDPVSLDVRPSIQPAALLGSPVTAQPLHVEALTDIVGFRLIADPAWVQAIARPAITLRMGFVDAQGNWQATDRDRTIILRTDPQDGGRLQTSDITIPRGETVATTTFTPAGEGTTKILAEAGGLSVTPATVVFKYALFYFLFIALVGAVCGGSIQFWIQKDAHGTAAWLQRVGIGVVCGVVAYIVAPALVSVGFKPEALQNASKAFEAFLWGFIGGGGGPAIFAALWKGKGATTPARQPAGAGKG